jgi:hypothetical protein
LAVPVGDIVDMEEQIAPGSGPGQSIGIAVTAGAGPVADRDQLAAAALGTREVFAVDPEAVAIDGADAEFSEFNLKRPQPALRSLLASGYSPIYPCHVSRRDMRTHPIGRGPFKFAECTVMRLLQWRETHSKAQNLVCPPNRDVAVSAI